MELELIWSNHALNRLNERLGVKCSHVKKVRCAWLNKSYIWAEVNGKDIILAVKGNVVLTVLRFNVKLSNKTFEAV